MSLETSNRFELELAATFKVLKEAEPCSNWAKYMTGAREIPSEMADGLDDGRVIVIPGRSSSAHGEDGRRLASNDLIEAVAIFAENAGLDFRHLVPERDQLMEMLKSAPTLISEREDKPGHTFQNAWAHIDLRPAAPVVLIVSAGTGHYLAVGGEQPFVKHLGDVLRCVGAICLACKRADRLGRQAWGMAPIGTYFQSFLAFLADQKGLELVSKARSQDLFTQGSGSMEQASELALASGKGQRDLTDTRLIEGIGLFHNQHAAPPGLDKAVLKSSSSRPSAKVIFLDNDACRPPANEIADGSSGVHYENEPDKIVDQVANVRFVLAHYGHLDWPLRRLTVELFHRRFSTNGLRMRNKPWTIISRESEVAANLVNRVLDNLSVYETGIFRRVVNGGVETVIENVIPLDGPWATPEDFDRIRRFLKDRKANTNRRRILNLAGLTADFNGQAVKMTTYTHQCRLGNLTYMFKTTPIGVGHERPAGHLTVPADAFNDSIIFGITSVCDEDLRLQSAPWRRPHDVSLQLAELRQQKRRIEQEMNQLQRLFREVDAAGEHVHVGAIRKEWSSEYNTLAAQSAECDRLVAAEVEAVDHHIPSAVLDALELNMLTDFIAALKDPLDCSRSGSWKAALKGLKFTSSSKKLSQGYAHRLAWSGSVDLVTDDRRIISIDFDGEWLGADSRRQPYVPGGSNKGAFPRKPKETRVAPRNGPKHRPVGSDLRVSTVAEVVDAMAKGQPFQSLKFHSKASLRQKVAQHWGADERTYILNGCENSRVTKIGAAILTHTAKNDYEIAVLLDDDENLVARIREKHFRSPGIRWVRRTGKAEVALHIAASDTGLATSASVVLISGVTEWGVQQSFKNSLAQRTRWTATGEYAFRLEPCTCGSTVAIPVTMPEVLGGVCVRCFRDDSGVIWSASLIERFVAHRDLWGEHLPDALNLRPG